MLVSQCLVAKQHLAVAIDQDAVRHNHILLITVIIVYLILNLVMSRSVVSSNGLGTASLLSFCAWFWSIFLTIVLTNPEQAGPGALPGYCFWYSFIALAIMLVCNLLAAKKKKAESKPPIHKWKITPPKTDEKNPYEASWFYPGIRRK